MRLKGKNAIVTGSARGLGASIAADLAREGARVMLCDVLDDLGRVVAASIGDAAVYRRMDVTRSGEWAEVVGAMEAEFGSVDVLVNNAALIEQVPFDEVTEELFKSIFEVNALGTTLRVQRLGAMEATALLRTVMAEIEVAVFTFDNEQRLRLVNRAGEKLLNRPAEQLLGRNAAGLGLADCLQGDPARTLQRSFPGGTGRWGMRRTTFREGGLPHQLVVIADLSRALREEERLAWQRLVRVLGHELNNSLAPIKSIAGSLENLISRPRRRPDWEEDLQSGLSVISSRADALSRFMSAYAHLARLPQPNRQSVNVGEWVRQVIGIETRMKVALLPGPEVTIQADRDQLEQLLINLLRNAVDATLETGGRVELRWTGVNGFLEVLVEDEGPGLSNTANLFVPFFTTKPGGSGIGLALSRQIAEGHGGSLTLENRRDKRGCEARLRLPL